MVMPADGTEWPPTQYRNALTQVANDSAWLTGDLPAIRDQITKDTPQPYTSRAQFNGGIVGGVARGVLGKPPRTAGSAVIERHLPVAAELVTVSANQLAKKPPRITLHDDDADQQVETVNEDGTITTHTVEGNRRAAQALSDLTSTDLFAAEWLEACQKISGHGFHYARIVWNQAVQASPWIEWVDGDQAYATYANGRQVSVMFWDTYTVKDSKKVFRLLQEHTPGQIEYALYDGTDEKLGMRVPVTDHPDTAHLADVLDADSTIKTGMGHITARQFINLERNPAWRTDPQLRYYGVSDVQKAGTLWADINKAWTDFMHEVDVARHRLVISEDLLETGAPGSGSVFDWFRDVFPIAQGGDADGQGVIRSVQPDMRVEKYLLAVDGATRKAIDAVGQSPIAVGMDPQASGQMTATETRTRWAKTLDTFDAKARNCRAGLSELLTAYLHLDAQLQGYQPPTQPVNVAIVEPVQDTELDEARTLGELRTAGIASIRYCVDRLHPEWTEEQVDAEVTAILDEQAQGMPVDPFDIPIDADPAAPTVVDADSINKLVTAATALIRAGYLPDAALEAVGLDPIQHTGLLPVTLRGDEQ